MNKENIGILGCGWLGFPLAKQLVANGSTIYGTTTGINKLNKLKEAGIIPFHITISENIIAGDMDGFLANLQTLIINIPPRLRGKGHKENYIKKMGLVHAALKNTPIQKVIFASSTSVYGDLEGKVYEDSIPTPNTESGKQLLQSEKIFLEDPHVITTVIRFGGLIGPDRHPITMLSGKENLTNGNAPLNLIHLNDCIGIIAKVMTMDKPDKIINAVYPYHPSKEEYYTQEALKRGIEPPHYQADTGKHNQKIIVCKFLTTINYGFLTSI
ncbi:SDR family NAD(P)-dependent oxidoreductase [Maribacter sp. CXY002]|uniref:SDR family NAD(P)-dependent oxidoreductase n=1 Tax=Maribacter luteocoastalis TaxID=3407671 RepID=UPI003B673984